MSSPQSFSAIVGPGKILNVAISGSQFYFPVATGQLYARVNNGSSWSLFVQGTGQKFPRPFSQVEIQNPGASPLVVQIVASEQGFIDKRLVANLSVQNVLNVFAPTVPPWVGANPYELDVPDLSGQEFLDPQGNKWIAIARVSFTTQLLDSGVLTIRSGAVPIFEATSTGGPLSPYILECAGPFHLTLQDNAGGIGLDIAVFEIYQAIQPGYAANPPS